MTNNSIIRRRVAAREDSAYKLGSTCFGTAFRLNAGISRHIYDYASYYTQGTMCTE